MNKKGFVFIESILVLSIVVTALTLLLASYTSISKKAKANEYYDKISDKYLLYSINNLGDKQVSYYPTTAADNFKATAENCSSTKMGQKIGTDCQDLFNNYGLDTLYVISNIADDVLDVSTSHSAPGYGSKKIGEVYDNGTLEYINTIREKYSEDFSVKYMIGVFYKNGHYFYSSIEL